MENKDYVSLHDELTGQEKRYRPQDVDKTWVICKRVLELFTDKEMRFSKKMIFQGDRQGALLVFDNLLQEGYIRTIPNLDKIDYTYVEHFIKISEREIGIIHANQFYSVKEGAKPFWTEE